MFSLDDVELDRLMDAAALLPTHHRDAFLRSVAGRVNGNPSADQATLETAITFVLNSYGIGGGPDAFARPHKPRPERVFFK
jgi:hypothetical protein